MYYHISSGLRWSRDAEPDPWISAVIQPGWIKDLRLLPDAFSKYKVGTEEEGRWDWPLASTCVFISSPQVYTHMHTLHTHRCTPCTHTHKHTQKNPKCIKIFLILKLGSSFVIALYKQITRAKCKVIFSWFLMVSRLSYDILITSEYYEYVTVMICGILYSVIKN